MDELLVVIGGSTASGKSALAQALALRMGGVIVNADSQQLFHDLPTLTARPAEHETTTVPHLLYGVLGPEEQPSIGRWLALTAETLATIRAQRRPALVVGGSGLYLHALLHGVPAMPEIPRDLRNELRAWAMTRPSAEIHARLSEVDPAMAARLCPGDRQRMLRALEVRLASGRSLLDWQGAEPQQLPLPGRIVGIALLPPADVVAPRIQVRLSAMLAAGAMREVEELLARRPDALSLPVAKVHGMRELAAVARGELSQDAAVAKIEGQIRRYAKRQRTWFRYQLPELAACVEVGESDSALRFAADAVDRAGVHD